MESHSGGPAWGAFDCHAPACAFRALGHTAQADSETLSARGQVSRVETAAIVGDDDGDHAAGLIKIEDDYRIGGVRMFADVRERFLH